MKLNLIIKAAVVFALALAAAQIAVTRLGYSAMIPNEAYGICAGLFLIGLRFGRIPMAKDYKPVMQSRTIWLGVSVIVLSVLSLLDIVISDQVVVLLITLGSYTYASAKKNI